ncbi:N-acetylated-alpha-linked acidic dipeptidase 2-like [Ornithodoros turicata]|uniref:N-acetylated-alpha-linked acidic dipeptidase 2-like n=1 Tax=Ornithodoros turicata TaxID=34597 RepID=UPI0031393CDA
MSRQQWRSPSIDQEAPKVKRATVSIVPTSAAYAPFQKPSGHASKYYTASLVLEEQPHVAEKETKLQRHTTVTFQEPSSTSETFTQDSSTGHQEFLREIELVSKAPIHSSRHPSIIRGSRIEAIRRVVSPGARSVSPTTVAESAEPVGSILIETRVVQNAPSFPSALSYVSHVDAGCRQPRDVYEGRPPKEPAAVAVQPYLDKPYRGQYRETQPQQEHAYFQGQIPPDQSSAKLHLQGKPLFLGQYQQQQSRPKLPPQELRRQPGPTESGYSFPDQFRLRPPYQDCPQSVLPQPDQSHPILSHQGHTQPRLPPSVQGYSPHAVPHQCQIYTGQTRSPLPFRYVSPSRTIPPPPTAVLPSRSDSPHGAPRHPSPSHLQHPPREISQPSGVSLPSEKSVGSDVHDPHKIVLTSEEDIRALKKIRIRRYLLQEWVIVWLFIVTLAVACLCFLVVRAWRLPRIEGYMQEDLKTLRSLVRTRYFFNDSIERYLVALPRAEKLKGYLRELSKEVHVAGTKAQYAVAEYIEDVWKSNGLDTTKMINFSVILSSPSPDGRNTVELCDEQGSELFTIDGEESTHLVSLFMPPYNAYSPAGNLKAAIIYCNRCLPSDFITLSNMGVHVSKKICLCRDSHKIAPGDVLGSAAKENVAGVLFFLDPKDVAPDKGRPVYPNNWWMPGNAVRRAHVRAHIDIGDPSTPGYASRPHLTAENRYDDVGTRMLPVLSQPIGYNDADKIMRLFRGRSCPNNWKPMLSSDCVIGDSDNVQAQMTITNKLYLKKIHNVIGYITGAVEPDRYVLVGVPSDSWATGAVSPGTATVQALELSRIFSILRTKKSWHPRRTIVFAAWDGQQFGSIGATEFVEAHRHKTMTRAVVYINSDMCASGGQFLLTSSPALIDSFVNVSAVVPHFTSPKESFYNVWKKDSSTIIQNGKPELPSLRNTGGSVPFVQYTGLPSLDVSFGNNHSRSQYYPALGTRYDTFDLVENFIDPGFKVQHSCTQIMAVLIRRWADVAVLPYDLQQLRDQMYAGFEQVRRTHRGILRKWHLSLEPVQAAVSQLGESLEVFYEEVTRRTTDNPLFVRTVNDMLLNLERAFVQQELGGPPGRARNVIYGSSRTDKTRLSFFPTLMDALFEQKSIEDRLVEAVPTAIISVVYALQQAAHFIDISNPL